MLPKPESACFVIADISGYTSFLNGAELDHAHDIIADVMDTVVRRLRPPFRLAKFEGDAAFMYAVADKVDGSLLQDAVEFSLFRIPQAAPQYQVVDDVPVRRVPRYAAPRPQVRLPSW